MIAWKGSWVLTADDACRFIAQQIGVNPYAVRWNGSNEHSDIEFHHLSSRFGHKSYMFQIHEPITVGKVKDAITVIKVIEKFTS